MTDPSFAALDPEPVVLPVKPSDTVVGIRPRTGRGNFPENSIAKFDIIALDADGQRRGMDNLTYQIFEEGRSFEWFQSEGHWDYKPQQQRRRIGGSSLAIADNTPGIIEWPVTAGNYQLEITNADGNLVARKYFNAGWGYQNAAETGTTDREKQESAALNLKSSVIGKQQKLTFTLAHAALVTTVIADDHIRSIMHDTYPAGVNNVTFTPTAEWGNRIVAHMHVRYAGREIGSPDVNGQILLSSLTETSAPPQRPTSKPVTTKTVMAVPANQSLKETLRRTLAPQQTWNAGDAKTRTQQGQPMAFLAAEPFYDAPALLDAMLDQRPFATKDLARRLETMRQWHDIIVASTLLPEPEMRAQQNDGLLRLLSRQKIDGGFAPFPGGESDIISTAASIETLVPLNNALTRPALAQATGWLRHRLENTWFGEEERPARAAAFAALAAAGKMDNAALHYFSDTSAEKTLPPLASAQMAYAFAAIHDKPASGFWIDKARGTDANKILTADTLPVLFANEYFTPGTVRPLLEKTSKQARASSDDVATIHDALMALWQAQNRAGAWRLDIGKETKNLRGVWAYAAPEKAPATLRNPSKDRSLNLVVMNATKAGFGKNTGQRHIYTLEGSEATDAMTLGATYVVILEGAWPSDAKTALTLNDNPQPTLTPITCAIDAPAHEGFLGWLTRKNPAPVNACEKTSSGVAVLLTRDDKNGNQWRIAYLAKATGTDTRNIRPPLVQPFALPNPGDKDDRH
jgi:hypothetical protein